MKKKLIFFIIIVVSVVAADQLTKYMIMRNVSYGSVIKVVPGILNINHVHNTGAAFGFLSWLPARAGKIFFLIITSIALIILSILYFKTEAKKLFFLFALALIFAGALGNFIDRLCYGWVIDFIDVYVYVWHWPSFNVADSAITIGAVYLGLSVLWGKD